MPVEKPPEHEPLGKFHFDDLPNRIQAATHAGVKGKHLRAVTVLGTPQFDLPANYACIKHLLRHRRAGCAAAPAADYPCI